MTPNELAIRITVAVVTGGTGDPDPLISIAKRESNFNHLAVGDEEIAAKVFDRDREKIRDKGSPWTDDPDAWAGSFGLFQLMAPYETQRWRADAHPSVLFHPVIATILAMRKWNRAIDLGAQNAVDVRMVWAFGGDGLAIDKADERYTTRVASERKRWRDLGLPGDPLDPVKRFANAGTVTTANQQSQARTASERLGISLVSTPDRHWEPHTNTTPETDDPTPNTSPRPSSLPWILGAVSIGAVAWIAWQKQPRPSLRLAA
jgi:hypothetical protein